MLKINLSEKLIIGLTRYLPSNAKVLVYRLKGANIGKNVRIGWGSYIFAEKAILKDGVVIGNDVHIVCREIVIDDEAVIDDEVRIGGESTCKIGKRCFVGQRGYINVAKPVILEDDVGMGGHVYTHGVWPPYLEGYPRKFEGVTIKRGAWVPPDTTILPGVTIGEEAIVGTGAVVTKSIPSRAFAVGVPAKVTKNVSEIQVKLSLDQKDARFKEIINDFHAWIKGSLVVERHIREGDVEFILVLQKKHLLQTRRWGIYYAAEDISSELIDRLLNIRKKFARIAIIALKGLNKEILESLKGEPELNDIFDWVDLASYSCRVGKNDFLLLLLRFFRSHYGVRLKSENK